MALRDQPYLPLYIQDIMTDEKLNECSAATHGIYIKGIMCLMHKNEVYGKILLKQKYKQTESKEKNFALQLAKQLPYSEQEIFLALTELINEKVCFYEDDYLVQKRMVRDNILSETRAKAGKKGGDKQKNFAKAKVKANSEYENANDNENNTSLKEDSKEEKFLLTETDANKAVEYAGITLQKKYSVEKIKELWKAFLIQNKEKFAINKQDKFSHFLNWLKFQKLDLITETKQTESVNERLSKAGKQ